MSINMPEIPEIAEDTQKGKFLTFRLGKEEYGLDIRYVTEIVGIQAITEIPEMPGFIKGIINLRGKIIPVMDVRLRFKKEVVPYDDRTCIVVVDMREISMGLIIDGVSEVLAIPEAEITPPPQIGRESVHPYVKGIGKVGTAVKLLLDCEKLLDDTEVETLKDTLH